MPRGAQDLGNAIYAAHITWRQVGPLARYFNAYASLGSPPPILMSGNLEYTNGKVIAGAKRARPCGPAIVTPASLLSVRPVGSAILPNRRQAGSRRAEEIEGP